MSKNSPYLMEYIQDKALYKAVMWSRKMIREGLDPRLAHSRAAKYHRVSIHDVAHHVGTVGGNVQAKRRKRCGN